jgi:NAD+ kinase
LSDKATQLAQRSPALVGRKPAHVVVYGNPHKPGIGDILRSLAAWAAAGGHRVSIEEDIAEMALGQHGGENDAFKIFNGDQPGLTFAGEEHPTLLLTLGGDGTMFHAIHRFWPLRVPVLGVNLGTLSFNATVQPEGLVGALNAWLAGEYRVSERMVLRLACVRRGEVVSEAVAVNDVVLGKQENLRMIHMTLRQGPELVFSFSGDGLIVSTPTGSTAYNLSAGGPIVFPTMRVLVATAICPHTLAARAVVLNPSPPLVMEFVPRYAGDMATLSIDGQSQWTLHADDKVTVEGCDVSLKLVVGREPFYFGRLRQKLGLNDPLGQPEAAP